MLLWFGIMKWCTKYLFEQWTWQLLRPTFRRVIRGPLLWKCLITTPVHCCHQFNKDSEFKETGNIGLFGIFEQRNISYMISPNHFSLWHYTDIYLTPKHGLITHEGFKDNASFENSHLFKADSRWSNGPLTYDCIKSFWIIENEVIRAISVLGFQQ